jgi:hypothetical protein
MVSKASIAKRIYRRHLNLYRFLNDTFIFTLLMLPELQRKAEDYKRSKVTSERLYSVPKKGMRLGTHRTDQEISRLLQEQYERGVFESLLISVISRVEAHLQECVRIAHRRVSKKTRSFD